MRCYLIDIDYSPYRLCPHRQQRTPRLYKHLLWKLHISVMNSVSCVRWYTWCTLCASVALTTHCLSNTVTWCTDGTDTIPFTWAWLTIDTLRTVIHYFHPFIHQQQLRVTWWRRQMIDDDLVCRVDWFVTHRHYHHNQYQFQWHLGYLYHMNLRHMLMWLCYTILLVISFIIIKQATGAAV